MNRLEGTKGYYLMRHGRVIIPGIDEAKRKISFDLGKSAYRVFRDYLQDINYATLDSEDLPRLQEQARQLPSNIDLILTSDYKRTLQTAEVVQEELRRANGRACELIVEPALREVQYDPESLTRGECLSVFCQGFLICFLTTGRLNRAKKRGIQNFSDEFFERWARSDLSKQYHGERPTEFAARVKVLNTKLESYAREGRMPLGITHAGLIRGMKRFHEGIPVTEPRTKAVSEGSISFFEARDK